jgi:hypothetical protein
MVYGILTGTECLRVLQIKNMLNCSRKASRYIRIACSVRRLVYTLSLRVHTKV